MHTNIINKQTKNRIGKIHQNPAIGELYQHHIAFSPFEERRFMRRTFAFVALNDIDGTGAEKDTDAEEISA